jgi:hypothetical protein
MSTPTVEKLQETNKTLLETVNNLSLKLHYAEMVLEDVRDICKDIPSDIYADIQTFTNSETVTPHAALLIHPNGRKEFRTIIDEMQDIQVAVGGYFELIEETDYWYVYCNEDKDQLLKLSENFQATSLLHEQTLSRFNLELHPYPHDQNLLLGQVLFVFKNVKDNLDKKAV